jgi:hypothetical protein
MSDKAQTPEAIALELYYKVIACESKLQTRDYILSTYAECLKAVKGTYGKSTRPVPVLAEQMS